MYFCNVQHFDTIQYLWNVLYKSDRRTVVWSYFHFAIILVFVNCLDINYYSQDYCFFIEKTSVKEESNLK